MKMNPIMKSTVAGLAIALFAGPALAADEPGTTYKFGGYVKFDAMFTDYSDGAPTGTSGGNSLIRQFYFPAQLPVGDGSADDDITADFQARETRLNFRADTLTEGGDKITAFVEMDFFLDRSSSTTSGRSAKPGRHSRTSRSCPRRSTSSARPSPRPSYASHRSVTRPVTWNWRSRTRKHSSVAETGSSRRFPI
jgi:hypothetical protein